jgi:hypothetical protein
MAATKTDPLAAKQAKQKKLLIALSVVLVAVVAIQLPRIMGGDEQAAAPATETTADPASTTTAPTTTDTATTAYPATTPSATTAPTQLADASRPRAGEAQLASFSLFEAKDPFVQQIEEPKNDAPGAVAASPEQGAVGDPSTPAAGGVQGQGGDTAKAVEPAPTNATISVNGEPEALVVKAVFPTSEPMFVLASLKDKQARIGIAGGSLKNGKTVVLKMGKKLTLVDTATGARYTLDLLYTGDAPEETAAFSTGEAAATP